MSHVICSGTVTMPLACEQTIPLQTSATATRKTHPAGGSAQVPHGGLHIVLSVTIKSKTPPLDSLESEFVLNSDLPASGLWEYLSVPYEDLSFPNMPLLVDSGHIPEPNDGMCAHTHDPKVLVTRSHKTTFLLLGVRHCDTCIVPHEQTNSKNGLFVSFVEHPTFERLLRRPLSQHMSSESSRGW
jgi:hypothetical protein